MFDGDYRSVHHKFSNDYRNITQWLYYEIGKWTTQRRFPLDLHACMPFFAGSKIHKLDVRVMAQQKLDKLKKKKIVDCGQELSRLAYISCYDLRHVHPITLIDRCSLYLSVSFVLICKMKSQLFDADIFSL